ncbi:T9SS type B sorting domain-containing protein [Olleya sp. YS]|uniref:T9SS type B sorting domain-containing protein n=1 Tax=Olleya sp. YS TaxID=3028318 RepID=UPI00243468C3|nr:T9SS type B sorting domain-containing protein [Olleya sp. YS]WGD33728.1 T9SS type B sorting domain-containing protein [Olleya sp. YS]
MRFYFLFFYLLFSKILFSQNVTVSSYQKINDLNGGFSGILNDQDNFGVSIDNIEDLDGNGVNDLIVGSFSDDDGGTNRGAVWILFLDSSNNVINETKISNTSGGFGGALDNNDRFGGAVSYLGDLNGDGKIEVAVGADYDGDGGVWKGAVWILSLNLDGTVFSHSKISSTSGNFNGNINGDAIFGTDIENIGDLNNDGIDDLAVGSRRDNDGGGNEGAVWILFLNSDFTVNDYQKISETSGGLNINLGFEDYFGGSVANLGDLNGDGVIDIAVGSYRDDDSVSNSGAIYILFLNQNGTVNSTQKISNIDGGFSNEFSQEALFGESIDGVSDRDGDGKIEIIVGAMKQFNPTLSVSTGGFYVIELNSDGTMSEFEFYSYNENCFQGQLANGDLFSGSVTMLTDSTFAIGAYGDSENGFRKGAVWILEISDASNINVNTIDPTVCGTNDGSIIFSSFIPNTSYTVSFDHDGQSEVWIPDSNSSGEIVLSNLNEGLYSNINITQSNDLTCNINIEDVVLTTNDFVLNFSVNSNVDCGVSTGSILIENLAPNTSYIYDYEFDSLMFSGSFISDTNGEWIIDGLSAGDYEFLMVVDSVSSCTDGIGLLTIGSASLNAGVNSNNPTLCNTIDGSIVFTGLTTGLHYTINYELNGNITTLNMQADISGEIHANSLGSGVYESLVIIEDLSGCSQDFGNVTLTTPIVDYNFSVVPSSSCVADGAILITGLIPNSEHDVFYDFNGVTVGDLIFSDASGYITLLDLSVGTYQNIIVHSYSDGCSDSEMELIIPVGSNFTATITSNNPTGCNMSDGIISIGGLEDESSYTIVYNNNGVENTVTLTSNSFGELNITGLSFGSYSSISITEDSTGCVANLDSITLTTSNLTATIDSINPTSCNVSDGVIILSDLGDTLSYTISYDYNGVEVNITLSSNSLGELNITDLSSGIYDNITIIEDSTGCVVNASLIDLVCFDDLTECIKVKKFFTPNNDTVNDVWKVEVESNFCDFELYIFDRYGKLLKTLTPNNRFWDGTFKGLNMPTNDYWYLVEYKDELGFKKQLKSHFTLKR